MTPDQFRKFASEWAKWRDDPDRFNSVALGRPGYWFRQREICRSLVDYRVTVVYAGNAVGKSFLLSGAILWWLYTRPGSLVICTGASQTSIGSILWKEVRRAVESSPFPAPRMTTGIKASPAVCEVAPGWMCLAYSTTSIERASGQHAKDLLVICDEASALEPEIFDALESLKYTRLLCMGNPIRAEGPFVDLIRQAEKDHRDRIPPSKAVNAIRIPSTDSPDADKDHSDYGLADRTWLEACYRRYGKDSLWVRSHIDAIIPSLLNEQLIPAQDLDRCISADTLAAVNKLRADPKHKPGKKRLGCDVGEGCGNARTVIFVRDDLGILKKHASRYTGPGDAAELMVRLALEMGIAPEDCSYDGAGQTGKRLGNALAKRGFERARPFFGSSSGGKRCTNLRTACALALARRLDADHFAGASAVWHPFAIAPDSDWEAMREELLGLRYHLQGDQSALEQKDEFMERLGRSPDFSDALCQTFRQEAIEG